MHNTIYCQHARQTVDFVNLMIRHIISIQNSIVVENKLLMMKYCNRYTHSETLTLFPEFALPFCPLLIQAKASFRKISTPIACSGRVEVAHVCVQPLRIFQK